MQGYYENHRDDMAHASAWYKKDDRFTPHFHNSIELVYVLEGALLATLDGQQFLVPKGTMLINSSYTVHSYETPESSLTIIAIIPMAEVPSAQQLLHKKAFADCLCPDDPAQTLGTLMRMMADIGLTNPLIMKGLCYAVLGLLIDRVGLSESQPSSRTAFIRSVLDYLSQHHTEPLTVQSISEHFGYSRSRFSHVFSAQLGCTLTDYLSSLRLRHAAQQLRQTDTPVSEIALAVGFESVRTFYRAFKRQYEMTPKQHSIDKSRIECSTK